MPNFRIPGSQGASNRGLPDDVSSKNPVITSVETGNVEPKKLAEVSGLEAAGKSTQPAALRKPPAPARVDLAARLAELQKSHAAAIKEAKNAIDQLELNKQKSADGAGAKKNA